MNSEDLIFEFIFLIFFGFIGLCLGSFATAIIYREQRSEKWFLYKGHSARSYCPECKTNLSPRDLIPVWSWLLLKGKCRHCQAEIPFFYPFIEILSGSCAIIIFALSGLSVISFTALLCLPFLLSLIYLGIVHKSFSWRLVIIVALIGVGSFLLQILTFG